MDAGHRPTCHCLKNQGPIARRCSSRVSLPARRAHMRVCNVARLSRESPAACLHALHGRAHSSRRAASHGAALCPVAVVVLSFAALRMPAERGRRPSQSVGPLGHFPVSRRVEFIYQQELHLPRPRAISRTRLDSSRRPIDGSRSTRLATAALCWRDVSTKAERNPACRTAPCSAEYNTTCTSAPGPTHEAFPTRHVIFDDQGSSKKRTIGAPD